MPAARKPKPPTGGAKKATSRAASVKRANANKAISSRQRMEVAIGNGLIQAGRKTPIRTRGEDTRGAIGSSTNPRYAQPSIGQRRKVSSKKK